MECYRITTEEQLQQAFAIRKEVFVEEQNVPVEEEIDEFDASVEACRHFLALADDGTPIGASRWREYEPGTAKLQRIAVLERYRGTGAGKLLVLSMEKDAAQMGYHRSILDAQCSAEQFYRKLGYATISTEPFLDAGIEHVRMSKDITG
ncbi:GNAT family N-acetyltransferase [Cohnella pontilimi]|uniref:GNAT family N-acetyltransferase n=1 Tax=Cohnella pontilimi TaxID=2564100 RepID=A0A4U0FHS6_9BACL|nr:GNAT family N-acetyltransferase [Cohnella pontilimi]TJY44583.1 GNAT family N-acetyltransferase [Cohnella pontilimi]